MIHNSPQPLPLSSPDFFPQPETAPPLCLPSPRLSLAPNSGFPFVLSQASPSPRARPQLPPRGGPSCTSLASRHLLGASHSPPTALCQLPGTHSPPPPRAAACPIPLTNLHVRANGGDSISLSLCSRPRRRRPLAAGFLCSRSYWPRSRTAPTNGLSAPVSLLRP